MYVIVEVEKKTTSNGVTGLFVTECSPAPVSKPKKRSHADWLAFFEREEQNKINILKETETEKNVCLT